MDYLKGASLVDPEVIRKRISETPVLTSAHVVMHDGAYIDLNGKLESLLNEARGQMPQYVVDLFDCDKFMRVLLGRVAELCYKYGLPQVVFVAWVNHWTVKGVYHAAGLVWDRGRLYFIEPQHSMIRLLPIEDHVRQAVEIWG